MLKQIVVAALLTGLGASASASAATIVSATGAVIISGGPGFFNIDDTFNQVGLIDGYVSGVTDFDAYFGESRLHASELGEWFSEFGGAASVIYDLGVIRTVESFALWNENDAGVGAFNLFYSTDNDLFLPLILGASPTDNPPGANYGADVYGFTPTALRYVRFDMFLCPGICGVGEVAFEAQVDNGTDPGTVPEPASAALLGTGMAAIAFLRRRRATWPG